MQDASNPHTAPRSDQAILDRKVLLHRSHIAQGRYQEVLSAIRAEGEAPDLRVVRLLAQLLAQPQSKPTVLNTLASLGAHPTVNVAVVGATIYAREGLYPEALTLLKQFPKHLEA